jgi:hypothetical protein
MGSISIVPNGKRFVKEKLESGISASPGRFGVCTLRIGDGEGNGFPALSHTTPFLHFVGAEAAQGNERSVPLGTNPGLTFGLRKRCL